MNVSRRRLLSWLPAVAAIPAIPAIAKLANTKEKPEVPQEVKAQDFRYAQQPDFVVENGQVFIRRAVIEDGTFTVYDEKGRVAARMGKL